METTISSSETARRLGEIFARASRGETFHVTQYGRPFVTICPPVPDAPAPAETPAAAKRAAKKARPPKKKASPPAG